MNELRTARRSGDRVCIATSYAVRLT